MAAVTSNYTAVFERDEEGFFALALSLSRLLPLAL
jgi:hypothetical protein